MLRGIRWSRELIPTQKGLRSIMVGRRRGRARRAGPREPNGKPQRIAVSREQIAAAMPHRAGLRAEVLLDHRAESALGRRVLMGHITEIQYDAGVCWRDLVQRYARVIDAPMPSPRSSAGALLGGNGAPHELSTADAERTKSAYNAAFCYMHEHAGHRATRAVSHCAVYDRDPDMKYLTIGLDALASHFRLTGTRKSLTVRNTRSLTAS